MQDPITLKRLTLSRYYLSLAADHAKSPRELDAFIAVNLLQEAVETFLVSAASQVNAAVKSREDFGMYFDKIDSAIAPKRLPSRSKMLRINKARVAAKHDIIVPDRSDIPGFVIWATDFLEAATPLIFQVDFSSISLVDALSDSKEKAELRAAEQSFATGNYRDCLVYCRRALYEAYEQYYDISSFLSPEGDLFAHVMCQAPEHAKSKDYILRNVKEPFDYIVLDIPRIDSDLLREGIDNHRYWNIWRLTPRVFRLRNGKWLTRHEPSKITDDVARDNAAFVLENAVELFLNRDRSRARQRLITNKIYGATTTKANCQLFATADKKLDPIAVLSSGMRLLIDGATTDFDGEDLYWKVVKVEGHSNPWIHGYILHDLIAIGDQQLSW